MRSLLRCAPAPVAHRAHLVVLAPHASPSCPYSCCLRLPWYQLDTPRSSGGGGGGGGAQLASAATHLGGYSSPRGRQPLTTGGSLVESAVDSNRPSSQGQFPVRTTSPMAVLNAGSSKTISQIMQEHSYASPRATQAGIRRSRSSSIAGRSSPYSPGRGLAGVGRSVTPPPSQGELTDVADELKRILGTAVETPRREPLNIQPPERPDEQSFIAPPPPTVALAPEPEPAPAPAQPPPRATPEVRSTQHCYHRSLSSKLSDTGCCGGLQPAPLDGDVVARAERKYAAERGMTPRAHFSALGFPASDEAAAASPSFSSWPQQQQQEQEQQQPPEEPWRQSIFTGQQLEEEPQEAWRMYGSRQDQAQQQQAQQQHEKPPPPQQQQDEKKKAQILSVTGRLSEQKFGLAHTINREWEEREDSSTARGGGGGRGSGSTSLRLDRAASPSQPSSRLQRLQGADPTLTLADFRHSRRTEQRQVEAPTRSSLADTLAEQRGKPTPRTLSRPTSIDHRGCLPHLFQARTHRQSVYQIAGNRRARLVRTEV